MSLPVCIAIAVSYPLLVALLVCWFQGARHRDDEPRSWFDHERFVNTALTERVKAYSTALVVAHPCSYGGELIEYPVVAGWDEDTILHTLAEIEEL